MTEQVFHKGRSGPLARQLLNLKLISSEIPISYVVGQFPNFIRPYLYNQNAPNLIVATALLVESCMRYTDGIEYLLDILRSSQGESISMKQIDTYVQGIHMLAIPRTILFDLYQIDLPPSLSPEELCDQYTRSLPNQELLTSDYPFTYPIQHQWHWIIYRLAEIEHRYDSTVLQLPLMQFISGIQSLISNTPAETELGKIQEQIRLQLKLPKTICDELSNNASAEQPIDRVDLLIEIERKPEPISRRINIQAWAVVQGQYHSLELTEMPDHPWMLDEKTMQEIMESIFVQIARWLIQAKNRMLVTFLLPHYMLDYAVETLPVNRRDVTRLGLKYPVVVRSLERARHIHYQPAWSHHRDLFTLPSNQIKPIAVHIVNSDQECQEVNQLYYKLCDGISCLMLGFGPPPKLDLRKGIIATLLTTGLPIAIWPQTKIAIDSDMRVTIESLVLQNHLGSLLNAVLRRRINDSNPQANHSPFTLFWDDPNQLPPCYTTLLEAPEK